MSDETYILFELAGATYALSSHEVQHIEMLEHVTPVPNAGPSVEGVIFSRGQVLPAMNLRERFGFPRQPHDLRTRLIIAQTQQRTVALIVDAAREFRTISSDSFRPIEKTLTGVNANYLRGVTTIQDRLILLLNLEAIIDLGASRAAQPSPETSRPTETTARAATAT